MRSEYPRPSFKRSEWVNLNGVWEFAFNVQHAGFAVSAVCSGEQLFFRR